MTTRIAVIADLHLTERDDTAQHAALQWALERLKQIQPDLIVLAGDATADGKVAAARVLLDRLSRCDIPRLLTPGNSDLRTPAESKEVCRLLSAHTHFEDERCVVAAVDTSAGRLSGPGRRMIEHVLDIAAGRQVALITHLPPRGIAGGDWILSLLKEGRIGLCVTGHLHHDDVQRIGRGVLHLVRGLDADKAAGGPPAMTLLELEGHQWRRQDIPFPDGDVARWTEDEREQFVRLLGISCMDDTLGGLAGAAAKHVACVEIRSVPTAKADADRLAGCLRSWRSAGGRYLSVHMPSLGWRDDDEGVSGKEDFLRMVDLSLSAGAQALTVHVPDTQVGLMAEGSPAWDALSDAHGELLAPALAAGLAVGVENMHTHAGQRDDGRRPFGCLPGECLGWIESLRRATDSDRIGMHLDIGHARNNRPFVSRWPLGEWYATVGGEITGYHIHQVRTGPDGLKNHFPITDAFGPLISLSSLLWGWRTGQLRRCPMFIEVGREGDGWETFDYLRRFISNDQSAAP